jgi:hypothetical protein
VRRTLEKQANLDKALIMAEVAQSKKPAANAQGMSNPRKQKMEFV